MIHTLKCASSDPLDLWLGKPAPRYTSYPTAPFFHGGVDAKDYTKSLQKIASAQPLALYIHIPFCRSLCLYCGCNTMITNRSERMEAYLKALMLEIEHVAALTGRKRVASLHFGGGTPNTLPEKVLRDLFDKLRQVFDFSSINEIAMELDPRLCTPDQARLLRECGVTRVSLGVQDFNDEVQKAIRRIQSFEQVKEVCGWLRDAGIAHINLDLIYGLPLQTPQTIANTATLACDLAPDRIALFSYAHVPQLKKHQLLLEPYGIPDMRERLALDQVARGILISRAYQSVGIDHFAKPGDSLVQAWRMGLIHRNFQGYAAAKNIPLIGFGASSISQLSEGYFQNEREARSYQECIESDHLATRRGFLLSLEDRVRGSIIERLMCSLSCNIEDICRTFDYPPENFTTILNRLKPYEQAGIIARKGYAICLITHYRMAVRVICSFFDDYAHRAETSVSRTA